MGIWTNLMAQYHNWKRVRETMHELESLDDRSLADLGINRVDIHQIAVETVAKRDRDARSRETGMARAAGVTLQAG